MFLDGADGIADCVDSHTSCWGMPELMQISPDPRLLPAADRVAAYIVSRQQPDGQWLGDDWRRQRSSVSRAAREHDVQRARVGLGYYLHLAAAEQMAPTAI